jgi:hypothetical protein
VNRRCAFSLSAPDNEWCPGRFLFHSAVKEDTMEFADQMRDLAEKAFERKDVLNTEEATKNALVMRFINIMGYDVFNPKEVIPEFTADVGIKKGEKVDYAILVDGNPIIIMECKSCTQPLASTHTSQLYRYFAVSEARFGVLTNGLVYLFYTDLDKPNTMDDQPFLEVDLSQLKTPILHELQKFSKESFNVDHILSTASELKYTREIKHRLRQDYDNPSEEFVQYFVDALYPGRKTQTVRDQFTPLAQRAFHQFVNDQITDRAKLMLTDVGGATADNALADGDTEANAQITTTEDELHAFYIVKSIMRECVEPQRVVMRDVDSYCGVLLDDNNRKPICRLRFNTSQKYLGLFDAQKKETRVPIQSLDDLYQFADRLTAVVGYYEDVPTA